MPNGDHRNDLMATLHRIGNWSVTNIRWFTRAAIFLLAAFLLLHRLYAPWADEVARFLGFPPPSLQAVIALILAVFILERTFVLEETIRQPYLQVPDRIKGEILQPKSNAEIGDTFVASGSARGHQHGLHLWLAIEIDGRIWPKEGGLLLADDGSWQANVFEEGTAEFVSLSLFAANDEGNEYLRAWLRTSDQTGSYPELRRTTGMRRLSRVDDLRRKRRSRGSIG